MSDRKVTIHIGAKDDASATVKRLRQEFEGLKGAAGRGSALKETLEALRGGGIAAGFGIGARMLGNWTGELEKINQQLRSGEISAGEMAEKFAASLPVLGDIYRAGRSIREILTSENYETSQILKHAQLINETVDAQRIAWDSAAKSAANLRGIAAGFEFKAGLIGLPPDMLSEAQAEQAATDRRGGVVGKAQADIAAVRQRFTERRQKLQGDTSTAQTQLAGEEASFGYFDFGQDDRIARLKEQIANNEAVMRSSAGLEKQAIEEIERGKREALLRADELTATEKAERERESEEKQQALRLERARADTAALTQARIAAARQAGDELGAELMQIEQELQEKLHGAQTDAQRTGANIIADLGRQAAIQRDRERAAQGAEVARQIALGIMDGGADDAPAPRRGGGGSGDGGSAELKQQTAKLEELVKLTRELLREAQNVRVFVPLWCFAMLLFT